MFNTNVFCLYSLYYLFYLFYWDSNAVILDIKSVMVVSNEVTLSFSVVISVSAAVIFSSAAANFVFSSCCILSISCVAEKFNAKSSGLFIVRKSRILCPYKNTISHFLLNIKQFVFFSSIFLILYFVVKIFL